MPHGKADDRELIARNEQLTKLMTPELHAYLLSLIPSPAQVTDVNNRHQGSFTASLKGLPEDIKECEADREASRKLQNLLHRLGKALATVDPNVPKMLGIEQAPEKLSSAAAVLSAPQDFKVVFNPKGQLVASVARVPGAKAYEVWGCEGDPMVEDNWKRLAESFNCKGILIAGYDRSKLIWLKTRAIDSNRPGLWSNVVTIEPI